MFSRVRHHLLVGIQLHVRLGTLIPLVILALSPPADVSAQSNLAELVSSGTLPEGIQVVVRNENGETAKGKVFALAPDALTIASGNQHRRLPLTGITTIERQDSLANGLFIGVAAGAAILTGVCKSDPDREHCPYYVQRWSVPLIGGGAAVGAVIDAAVRRMLYKRSAAGALPVAFYDGQRAAFGLALTW